MRRTFAVFAAAALLAACGSGDGASVLDSRAPPETEAVTTAAPSTQAPAAPTTKATTTVAPTTAAPTTQAPTTVAPTTTIGECVLEPPLLAERLIDVPGYLYAEYDDEYLASGLELINEDPAALEAFSALSRHLVTTDEQHLLGAFELLALRDEDMDATAASEIVVDMYTTGPVDVSTEMVGDVEIVYTRAASGAFDVWTWVDDGVAYTFWWTGFDGNEGYGTDFARAFAATMQDLPVPEPTAVGPEPGPGLDVEDEELAARLVPVDGFFYRDADVEMANEFYASFGPETVGGPLERATIHVVVSEEQVACGEEGAIGVLQLWEPTDEYKGDEQLYEAMITAFTSAEDSVSLTAEIDLGGETVTYATVIGPDGEIQGVFVWEYEGVVYVFYTAPGCADSEECTALVAQFMAGLISETVS